MGIDGIGGGGFKPPGSGGPKGDSSGFEIGGPSGSTVSRTGAVTSGGAADISEAVGRTDLEQLKSGELSFDQYLDKRVEQAVSHLEGSLEAEQLGALREQLRDQMSTDPVVRRLVQQATGMAPSSDDVS